MLCVGLAEVFPTGAGLAVGLRVGLVTHGSSEAWVGLGVGRVRCGLDWEGCVGLVWVRIGRIGEIGWFGKVDWFGLGWF